MLIYCLLFLLFSFNTLAEDKQTLTPDLPPLPVAQTPPQIVTPTQTDSAKDKDFGIRKQFENKKEFFARIWNDVKDKVSDKIQDVITATNPPPKKENPALKYPDPFFYDAVYKEERAFEARLYVYNDKTNPENKNIPEIYPQRFDNQIFQFAKDSLKTGDLTRLLIALSSAKNFDMKRFVNSRNPKGDTPLLIAIRNNNVIAITLLSQYGADPTICNFKNICPLHMAVINNAPEIAKTLLDYGADVMSEDIYGRNMIKFAIAKNYREMFHVLIDAYVLGDARQDEKLDFLKFAMSFGRDKYVEYMYYKFGFDSQGAPKKTEEEVKEEPSVKKAAEKHKSKKKKKKSKKVKTKKNNKEKPAKS